MSHKSRKVIAFILKLITNKSAFFFWLFIRFLSAALPLITIYQFSEVIKLIEQHQNIKQVITAIVWIFIVRILDNLLRLKSITKLEYEITSISFDIHNLFLAGIHCETKEERHSAVQAIRNFADKVGVAKRDNVIDVALLEYSIREDLNKRAMRAMAVLDPLKVVITNYSENLTEEIDAINNPENPEQGSRKIQITRELYIERDDFTENPPPKYYRLSPGAEVRLRYAYYITCNDVVKDNNGKITEIHCSYDPASKGGSSPDGRKVQGTIHWVSAEYALKAEVRLFDRFFINENPDEAEEGKDFKSNLNPDSLKVITALVEPSLNNAKAFDHYQFERVGYFNVDPDTEPDKLVFNRTVTLRDSWAKMEKRF